MEKKKFITAFKVIIIGILLMGIAFLAMIQWKSDVIINKAVNIIQEQLEDSLVYESVSLEWFRYFPSVAVEMTQMHLGAKENPLIDSGNIDVVVKLFPLFSEKVIINKLLITDGELHIRKEKNRWSYDLFKKQPAKDTIELADASRSKKSWEALVRQLYLVNTRVNYDDQEGTSFSLFVEDGSLKGDLSGEMVDAELEMKSVLDQVSTKAYKLSNPFPFELTGSYTYDAVKGLQQMKNWNIENDGLNLELTGLLRKEDDSQWVDMNFAWTDADPQSIKSLLPSSGIRQWNDYSFSGRSEGQLTMKGNLSKTESPRTLFSSELKNGSIRFPGNGGQLKNILLNIAYDSGEGKSGKDSYMRLNLRNGTFQGDPIKANLRMNNIENPVMDLEMEGAMPASLLNLVMDSSSWNFKEGMFEMEKYTISSLPLETFTTNTFIGKSRGNVLAKELKFNYEGDDMAVSDGKIQIGESGKVIFTADEFLWNKALGKDVEGEMIFGTDQLTFDLKGIHSQGKVETRGTISNMKSKPVLSAQWKVKDIEMHELLASFGNFDQTFITSENLKGKADIWTQTIIPYDEKGQILPRQANVKAAISIKEGELKNLRTLEDFSKYVHLDDLKDIRFNELKNYLKIENGKVFLPVMFIQSSAMNLSINGVHSFDHEILYHLKINGGQTIANKMKKIDVIKRPKQARKSGWINLYFILSGTVDAVKYEQDQKQVVSAFEQSSQMKEQLRKYLVDEFGHDVYWIEPNEWEDIPEYE